MSPLGNGRCLLRSVNRPVLLKHEEHLVGNRRLALTPGIAGGGLSNHWSLDLQHPRRLVPVVGGNICASRGTIRQPGSRTPHRFRSQHGQNMQTSAPRTPHQILSDDRIGTRLAQMAVHTLEIGSHYLTVLRVQSHFSPLRGCRRRQLCRWGLQAHRRYRSPEPMRISN